MVKLRFNYNSVIDVPAEELKTLGEVFCDCSDEDDDVMSIPFTEANFRLYRNAFKTRKWGEYKQARLAAICSIADWACADVTDLYDYLYKLALEGDSKMTISTYRLIERLYNI